MRISDWSSDVCSSDLQIAMDQNGDLSLNLTPETAAAMWKAGLINESQLGAIADGGHARFSFAHNDLLVSSGTDFSRSARSDTSTRFEAGKQAGPDTIDRKSTRLNSRHSCASRMPPSA